LNFEDFGENLDCSKFLYVGRFVLLLLFFFFSLFLNRAPKSLLKILMEVITKGYLELYWITKGLAMNEGKFLMLTLSVGVEQLWDVSKWKVCGCVLPGLKQHIWVECTRS
jgi:hypothetical protein